MKPAEKCKKLPRLAKKKLIVLTTLGVSLTALATICFVMDPVYLIAKYQMRVAPGFQLYDILRGEIDGAYVSAYLFNVTNAREFISGEDRQLKVQEFGPFTYQEKRLNKNFEVDEEAQELYYQPYVTATFLPEISIADPAHVNITIPNTALLAIATAISTNTFWSQLGLNLLTTKFNSKAVLTLPVKDYLWGYEEPLLAFGNAIMPGWINFRRLGLMDRLYDNTRDYRIELDLREETKFQIKRVNGGGGLPYWGYEDSTKRTRCNTFVDTYEGFSYPPGLSPEKPIRLFRNVFCRIIELEYVGITELDYGPEAYLYKIGNHTYCKNPDTECLCSRLGCVDGLSDLSPCFYGLPVMMSNAHFYGADPKLYERIDGIAPEEGKHGSAFLIEPKLGTELFTSMTFQLNVPVPDVGFNPPARPFSNMTVPIAYFKVIQPELKDDVKRVFWLVYVAGPYVMLALEVALLAVGLVLLSVVLRTVFLNCLIGNGQMTFQAATPANKLCSESPLISDKHLQEAPK
ncbi:unnamed protein product, partial [Iphiclides podalirius]